MVLHAMCSPMVGISIWKRFFLPTSICDLEMMLLYSPSSKEASHLWSPVVYEHSLRLLSACYYCTLAESLIWVASIVILLVCLFY